MLIKETFISIQGEGRNIGKMSLFIRMAGCNMSCPFCDTDFSGGNEVSGEVLKELILKKFKDKAIKNLVITGGEPTFQKELFDVIDSLADFFAKEGISLEIETNGWIGLKRLWMLVYQPYNIHILTVNLSPKLGIKKYKASKDEKDYFRIFRERDAIIVKLVVYGVEDLKTQLNEVKRVYGKIENKDIWVQPIDMSSETINELMKENMLGCRLSIQAHKFIGVK